MAVRGLVLLGIACLAACSPGEGSVVVFYAPCFAPVMDEVRDERLGVELIAETAGSQVCVRKVTELGRACDVLMLADSGLFRELGGSAFTWRLDFATDRIVLGVGIRAKRVDDAEKDWVPVLLDEEVQLGRVDENLGPIGYRTLLVWALKEELGHEGLAARLRAKAEKPVDHVAQLATLLKAGEVDYGFIYRTSCLKHDIRFIELDERVHLGSTKIDYSAAEVSFRKLKAGDERTVTVRGTPITYGLSIPANAPHREAALRFVRYLLEKEELFKEKGMGFFRPRFYGAQRDLEPFEKFAERAGEF